jgi:hypothetical protein
MSGQYENVKIHCGKYKCIEGWVFLPSILLYEVFCKIFPKKIAKSLDFTLKKSFAPKVSQFFVGKMTKAFGKKTVIGTIYEVEYC